ncbi:hypothetical protein D9X91_13785 [Falsibacillus albus]|uniref:Uncharacterized protein n=1 Tax=Falsibacillus albus TaxID=2478915 RepID=A0A3L7K1P8_9BACI|nr:hypothetical protein D9X91_13785 [Falsibacillus albus]
MSIVFALVSVYFYSLVIYRLIKKKRFKTNENHILITFSATFMVISNVHYSIKIISILLTITLIIVNRKSRKYVL